MRISKEIIMNFDNIYGIICIIGIIMWIKGDK